MFRIILACEGIPESEGRVAAPGIAGEFAEYRQRHKNVKCAWNGKELVLEAENDFDETGLALQDEFCDCISAYVATPFDGRLKVVSVTKIE